MRKPTPRGGLFSVVENGEYSGAAEVIRRMFIGFLRTL